MNNKKGFTLVELLAVIAILAILVIIALPNVMNMYTRAQKETFLTETKKIYNEAEKKYISNTISGNKLLKIDSDDNTKLDMTGEKLQYCVILNNKGKVTNMKVSNGKWIASLDNGKTIDELTIDDLEDGNLDDNICSKNQITAPKPINCTFNGKLKQGAEYINGQYIYRYMQKGINTDEGIAWYNISNDGWGVQLADKTSNEPITSKLCTYINNKPIISMSNMFYNSQATSVDLTSFNTTKVIDMQGMFSDSEIMEADISKFNTKNVTDMSYMFANIPATSLYLNKFNTTNVISMKNMFAGTIFETLEISNFDTKNVTDMSGMFYRTKISVLDLSNFDTNKVTNMQEMFY